MTRYDALTRVTRAQFADGSWRPAMSGNRSPVEDPATGRIPARVADLWVGPGTADGVTIGPLADRRAVAKCAELVADAVGRGACLTSYVLSEG